MWQAACGIAFELDAFLEIHEIKLHLLRAAPKSEIRNHDMEQSGLAGTGFAGDQSMLASALADGQILELGCASPSYGDAQFRTGIFGPNLVRRRDNMFERHLDAARIAAEPAHGINKLRRHFWSRRLIQNQRRAGTRPPGEDSFILLEIDAEAGLPELIGDKFLRQRQAAVPMNEHIDAATRAAGRDAQQPLGSGLSEVG